MSRAVDPRWLAWARAQIGEREIRGPTHNPKIVGWASWLGAKALGIAVRDDETPWCGVFAAAAVKSAGLTPPLIAVRARAWAGWGEGIGVPRLGAVAVFGRQGGGHVAFVTGHRPGFVRCVGGNQGDKVSEIDFPLSRLIGFRWPAGVPEGAMAPFVRPGAVSVRES